MTATHDPATTATGRCLCSGVAFHVTGVLRDVVHCHCERCRRTTGHHMAATGCATADLHLDADATLRWYAAAPGVHYGFCGTCGSSLFWRADGEPGWTSIAAGTLDQPTGLRTRVAWFTAEAADYHRLDDTLDGHARESPREDLHRDG